MEAGRKFMVDDKTEVGHEVGLEAKMEVHASIEVEGKVVAGA